VENDKSAVVKPPPSSKRPAQIASVLVAAVAVLLAVGLAQSGNLADAVGILALVALVVASALLWVSAFVVSERARLVLQAASVIVVIVLGEIGAASIGVFLVPAAIFALVSLSRTLAPMPQTTRTRTWVVTIVLAIFVVPIAFVVAHSIG
jgi:hypothetical protein